jgi:hypothetical protein
MNKLLRAALITGAMLAASPALAQQTPATSGAGAGAAAAGLPSVRHLVYQFGYNTKAAKSGTGTGTTTIDIVGLAKDGGMTVTATDNWWNTVKPRQSYTCEVYPNGGVTCPHAPYAISGIQIAVVPLLGQEYFSPLSAGPTATWQQKYSVKATFSPGAATGFAGQVYTWNCEYSLTGKGTPGGGPLILVHSTGSMKQQGGRYIGVNQKANILFDPHLKVPALVDEDFTFVPRLTVNHYTVEMKLIKASPQ